MPLEFRLKLLEFLGNRRTKVVRFVALHTGRIYTPSDSRGTPQDNSDPMGIELATFLHVALCLKQLCHVDFSSY